MLARCVPCTTPPHPVIQEGNRRQSCQSLLMPSQLASVGGLLLWLLVAARCANGAVPVSMHVYGHQVNLLEYYPARRSGSPTGAIPTGYSGITQLARHREAGGSEVSDLLATPSGYPACEGNCTRTPYTFLTSNGVWNNPAFLLPAAPGSARKDAPTPLYNRHETGTPCMDGGLLIFPALTGYKYYVVDSTKPGVWQERSFYDDVKGEHGGITAGTDDGWAACVWDDALKEAVFLPSMRGDLLRGGRGGQRIVTFSPYANTHGPAHDQTLLTSETPLESFLDIPAEAYAYFDGRNGTAPDAGGGDARNSSAPFLLPSAWGKHVRVEDTVILPPLASPSLVVYSMTRRTAFAVRVTLPNEGSSGTTQGGSPLLRYSGVTAVSRDVYAAPFDADVMLRCSLASSVGTWNNATTEASVLCNSSIPIPNTVLADDGTEAKLFSSAGCLMERYAVFTPYDADMLLTYDAVSDTFTTAPIITELIGVPAKWTDSAVISHTEHRVSGDAVHVPIPNVLIFSPGNAQPFALAAADGSGSSKYDPAAARVHSSDGGFTLGIVIFMIIFGVCLVLCCLYVHAYDDPERHLVCSHDPTEAHCSTQCIFMQIHLINTAIPEVSRRRCGSPRRQEKSCRRRQHVRDATGPRGRLRRVPGRVDAAYLCTLRRYARAAATAEIAARHDA